MTVVAAYRTKTGAWLGADSGLFDSDSVTAGGPKLWKTGGSLVAYAGTPRIAEVARRSNIGDPVELRNHLQDWYLANSAIVSEYDTAFLVANRRGLYHIDESFSLFEVKERYAAIGSSGLAALATLAALDNVASIAPADKVLRALRVAGKHTTGARPPYKVLSAL